MGSTTPHFNDLEFWEWEHLSHIINAAKNQQEGMRIAFHPSYLDPSPDEYVMLIALPTDVNEYYLINFDSVEDDLSVEYCRWCPNNLVFYRIEIIFCALLESERQLLVDEVNSLRKRVALFNLS